MILQTAAALIMSLTQPNGDAVPDFSRVGYRWGEMEIPEYNVVKVLEAPEDGSDATAMIQAAIDGHNGHGAILLKAGKYNVSGTIRLNRSNLVLRGEGDSTIIYGTGKEQRTLVEFGKKGKRVLNHDLKSMITGDYTPVGQMYVTVAEPELFNVGDRVVVSYFMNDDWIHEIRMDQIPQNEKGNVKQWTAEEFKFYWERIITDIQGARIYLDNPIVQGLDPKYGTAQLMPCSWDRISESGIENMVFDTEFDPSVVTERTASHRKGDPYMADEEHAWLAIKVGPAEHCWVRGVKSYHMGFGLARLATGSKNITVENCHCLEPVSIIRGNRRYAFYVSGGQLCLVRDCSCEHDRHGFATSNRTLGPSVFLNCSMTNAEQEAGPHQKWANGFLYDNLITDGQLAVQDGTNGGNGHGWRGANFYLWNCRAKTLICQSPWVSAKNYAVGCVGERLLGTDYKDNLGHPQGVWVSEGKHVEPKSLYDYQLEERKKAGVRIDIPEYYKAYLDGKAAEISELKQKEADGFFFWTDPHYPDNGGNAAAVMEYIQARTGVCKLFCGGDAAKNAPMLAEGLAFNTAAFQRVAKYGRMFPVRGNHDFTSSTSKKDPDPETMDAGQVWEYLCSYRSTDAVTDVLGKFPNYYYVDSREGHIRYVIFDTTDSMEDGRIIYGMSDRQLKWISDQALATVPEGWSIVFLSHVPLAPDHTTCNPLLEAGRRIADAAESHNVLFCLSGHRHSDMESGIGQVFQVLTESDCLEDNARTRTPYSMTPAKKKTGTVNEQSIDYVSISRGHDVVTMKRIGHGYDRVFNIRPFVVKTGESVQLKASLPGNVSWFVFDAQGNKVGAYGTDGYRDYITSHKNASITRKGVVRGLSVGISIAVATSSDGTKEYFMIKTI